MIVNFRARGISRSIRKLARTPTLIFFKKKVLITKAFIWLLMIYLPNSGDPHHLLS
jgi:hypothetical protein